MLSKLRNSKVYFHCRYDEPFGITVIEAIAAGCIPIVPNSSAHPETVPFAELRYKENCIDDAREKLTSAINGKFDYLIPKLQNHIMQFDEKNFQANLFKLLISQS